MAEPRVECLAMNDAPPANLKRYLLPDPYAAVDAALERYSSEDEAHDASVAGTGDDLPGDGAGDWLRVYPAEDTSRYCPRGRE